MNNYRLLISKIIFLCIWASACQQDSLSTIQSQTAVVEGYIYAGMGVDSIRITQSISYADSNLITLDELEPAISDGSNSFLLSSLGNGYYQNLALLIETGTSYQLTFDLNGEKVSAVTFIPNQRLASISTLEIEMERIEAGGFPGGVFGTPIDPIEISWDNPEGDYYYVLIDNLEENPAYINEFIQQRLEEIGEAANRFQRITEPEITDFYAINPQRDLQQFGEHRVIVYRVNPEYAALYESSSNSSLNIAEPPSNINNGLGIFTGVSSDTVYFTVKEK